MAAIDEVSSQAVVQSKAPAFAKQFLPFLADEEKKLNKRATPPVQAGQRKKSNHKTRAVFVENRRLYI